MVGEVDELEEMWDDQFPALKMSWVLKNEHWMRNSLINEAGTTIDTKFSLSHCIGIQF